MTPPLKYIAQFNPYIILKVCIFQSEVFPLRSWRKISLPVFLHRFLLFVFIRCSCGAVLLSIFFRETIFLKVKRIMLHVCSK